MWRHVLFLLVPWLMWASVIIFWPAPMSIESLGIEHTIFFIPLFAAILFTAHFLTHHPRRSVLIATGLTLFALMQLFRMVTILNIFLLVASILLIEFLFRRRRALVRARLRRPFPRK